jgi:hypothetical protein
MIESRMEPEDRKHVCISFGDFVGYWFETLNNPDGIANEYDIADFKKLYAGE